MNRRKFMFAGLGVGALLVGIAAWMRPADRGGPYDDYFRALNRELKANGPVCPVLLIDLNRLDHNTDMVMRPICRGGKHLRLVEKSPPSPDLLTYTAKRAGTRRLVSFHQLFFNHDAAASPNADIFLGKPLPVHPAELFYREHKDAFDPARQLQWLIDALQRLRQYLALAQGLGTRTCVNAELDVGLHRGGVADQVAPGELLVLVAIHSQHLEFTGFMSYDPFVGMGVPGILGSPKELFTKVMASYQGHVDFVRQHFAALWTPQLILNTVGSPSYCMHEKETLSSEVSVGTAMFKPSHYNPASLAEHVPVVYIVTPVLKNTGVAQILALDGKSRLSPWQDPDQRGIFFTYGGNWMADFASPEGLCSNGIYGRSSSQKMINGPPSASLEADNQAFLRLAQSESVLLQLGDLLVLRGGRTVGRWPVYAQDTWRFSQSMAAVRGQRAAALFRYLRA